MLMGYVQDTFQANGLEKMIPPEMHMDDFQEEKWQKGNRSGSIQFSVLLDEQMT